MTDLPRQWSGPIVYGHRWPDEARNGVWRVSRGWWFRIGPRGPGLHYRNISTAGYDPLFSERFGRDKSVTVRVGPHGVKLLWPARKR